jgi:DNA-binding transcriptional ArsR family regulator
MTTDDPTATTGGTAFGAREAHALSIIALFVHRCLLIIYGTVNVDLISLRLLDEIARHNLQPFATVSGALSLPDVAQARLMRGCNAYSLSQATGVPRETVRRKIKQLTQLGLIEQRNRKGLFVSMRWVERVSREQGGTILGEFREVSRQVEKALAC